MTTEYGVYVLMAFPFSNYQRFKNNMMRGSSILANYSGMVVADTPQVKVIEGGWPRNRTLAILYFSTDRLARQWLESDPTVKQPDFMDGMDCLIIPLKEPPPQGMNHYVVADIRVNDPETFLNEYSPKTAAVKEGGKVAVVAACPEPFKYRGTWKASMIIINQWKDEESYLNYYNSDEYQPLKELRQRITQSVVVTLPRYDC